MVPFLVVLFGQVIAFKFFPLLPLPLVSPLTKFSTVSLCSLWLTHCFSSLHLATLSLFRTKFAARSGEFIAHVVSHHGNRK